MASVFIAPNGDDARAKFDKAVSGAADPERARAQAFVGDPDTVAAQAQEYLDAGLDGITITMPDSHDVELVKLAGEALGAVIGTRTA
jgi:alkanesulfonate monooxygenase SsuD/methylene tetrahydromethanopterin reductase-like flavin-dependent oxidoreductase (luciferase family)